MKYIALPFSETRCLSFYLAMEEFVARHLDEPDAFFMCCERLDRLCRPPFSKETNEQAMALLQQMQSILTSGYDGPTEPEPQEMIEAPEKPIEEPMPRKRLFGLRR